MKILTIVVTYNGLKWIDRCLSSIRSSEVRTDTLVVDNASTDGTPEYVREHFPEFRLVETGENLGFGAGNDIGLRIAVEEGYDYVYLLNQDAYLHPGTIAPLLEVFRHDSDFGILSPLQTDAGGEVLDEFFAKKVSVVTGTVRTVSDLKGVGEDMKVIEIPFIMAAHWLISIDCVRQVGGFAPLFTHNGEDDNYCDRARYHGFKVGVCTSSEAIHDRSLREMTKERKMSLSCLTGNLARMANINATFADRVFYSFVFSCFKSVRYRSLTPLKYHFSLHKRFSEIRKTRRETKGLGAYL